MWKVNFSTAEVVDCNDTEPVFAPQSRTTVKVALVVILETSGLLTLACNSLLIFVHFRIRRSGMPFCRLILSCSFGFFAQSVTTVLLEPFGVLYAGQQYDQNPLVCKLAGGLIMLTHFYVDMMFMALAMERYLKIVHNTLLPLCYYDIYIGCDVVVSLMTVVPHVVEDSLGRFTDTSCIVNMRKYGYGLNAPSILLYLLAYSVTVVSTVLLIAYVLRYQRRNLGLQQRSRIQEDKMIVRVILLQCLMPIFLEVPLIIAYTCENYFQVQFSVKAVFSFMFYISGFVYPVLILSSIKPYTTVVRGLMKSRTAPSTSLQEVHAVSLQKKGPCCGYGRNNMPAVVGAS